MPDLARSNDPHKANKLAGVSFAGGEAIVHSTESEVHGPVEGIDGSLSDASQGIQVKTVVNLDTGKPSRKWSFDPALAQNFQNFKLANQSHGLGPHAKHSPDILCLDSNSIASDISLGPIAFPRDSPAPTGTASAAASTTSPKLSAHSTVSYVSRPSHSQTLPIRNPSLLQEPLTLQQTQTQSQTPSQTLSPTQTQTDSEDSSGFATAFQLQHIPSPHDGALVAAASARPSPPRSRGTSKQSHTFTSLTQEGTATIAEEASDLEGGTVFWKRFPFYRSTSGCSGGPCPTPTSSCSSKGGISLLFHSEEDKHLDLLPELVTFKDSQELLRASSLYAVIRCQGKVFVSSEGSASTYGLSREVPQIHTFISHNWSTSRRRKFLALAHHFNFHFAQAGATLFVVFVAVLGLLGKVPTIQHQSLPYPVGWITRAFTFPLFMILLFFQRDFLGFLGFSGPDVFLDKTCIHQVDPALKQRGIEKLPAFLSSSQYMLALYSDSTYLQKMWTVYEVAAFLALRPSRNMIICELSSVTMVYSGIFLGWILKLIGMAFEAWVPSQRYYNIIIANLHCVAYVIAFRSWAVDRAGICERLRCFNVYECKCALASDRDTLLRNIAVLMRTRANLPNAPEDEVLAFFNQLVQAELPQVFRAALNPLAISYKHIVTFAMIYSGTTWVDVRFPQPDPTVLRVLSDVLGNIFWWFIGMPLFYAVVQFIANSFLSLRGWRAWIRIAALFILLCEPFVLGFHYFILYILQEVQTGSMGPWMVFAVVTILAGLSVRIMFSSRFWEMNLLCK